MPGKELFFNGSVISDGRVTGAYYASGGNPAVFEIPEPLRCLDAPKPEEPKTPDAPKHAITGDVDVYTVPGGVGRPIGFVKKGTEVKILTRQTD